MSQSNQLVSFSVAAGLSAISCSVLFYANEPSTYLQSGITVTLLSALTSWLGFGLAKARGHEPSLIFCAVLGVLFVYATAGLVALLSFGFLHVFGFVGIALWFLIVAPIFVFLSCLFTKRVETTSS